MITKPFVNLPRPADNPDPDDLRAQVLKLSQEKFDRRKELIVGPSQELHHCCDETASDQVLVLLNHHFNGLLKRGSAVAKESISL